MSLHLALIAERKNPPDRRVVFSPKQCADLLRQYPDIKISVETSPLRVFPDQAYQDAGIEIVKDVSTADVLLGVKEVPIEALIPHKTYFFFSHTIKKQPYNRDLLRAILKNNITLYDHETLVKPRGKRLVGFGRYAGIVGAYNGFRLLGLRDNLFELPKAEHLPDLQALLKALDEISIPPIKIILTGLGKVAQGAREIIEHLGISEVSSAAFLNNAHSKPVFCNLDVTDYYERMDGNPATKTDVYKNPKAYKSAFFKYAKVADMLVTGHFYDENAPYLFTREMAKHPDSRINLVADVSCDIDGPIASTLRPSTIADPFYGYNPVLEKEVTYNTPNAIAVMAVDNLPCELPKDASIGFGHMFGANVIPCFFNNDKDQVLARAQITTSEGKLTSRFSYLEDYVK